MKVSTNKDNSSSINQLLKHIKYQQQCYFCFHRKPIKAPIKNHALITNVWSKIGALPSICAAKKVQSKESCVAVYLRGKKVPRVNFMKFWFCSPWVQTAFLMVVLSNHNYSIVSKLIATPFPFHRQLLPCRCQ